MQTSCTLQPAHRNTGWTDPFWQKLLNEGCCQRASPQQENNTGRDALSHSYPANGDSPILHVPLQMEVPSPLSSGSLCPHALPAVGSLSVAGVGLVSHPVDPPCVSISISLYLCLQHSAAHSFLLTALWTPGAPEGCSLLQNLTRTLGIFPLPVGCQAAGNSGDLSSAEPQAMHRLSWNWLRSGHKGSRPCLHLGSRPCIVNLPSSKKSSGANDEPYLLLPKVIQFPL